MSKGKHELILIATALIILGAMVFFASFSSPNLYSSALPSEKQTYAFPSTTVSSSAADVFNEYDIDAEYPSKDYSIVNINTADIETLCTLKGIGETKAKAIIEYRNENGKFLTAYDLANVNGISKATVEENIDRITV